MAPDIDALAVKKLLALGAAGLLGLAALTACDAETDSGTAASTETAEKEGQEAAENGDGTDLDAPLAAGSTVEIGDWSLSVASIELDATEAIMGVNQFNKEPADGFQHALLTIEGTYNGSETGALWLDVTAGIWADGAFYDRTSCSSVVDGSLTEAPDVSDGGTASGSMCIEIPSDAESHVVYVEDFMSFDDERYFIAID